MEKISVTVERIASIDVTSYKLPKMPKIRPATLEENFLLSQTKNSGLKGIANELIDSEKQDSDSLIRNLKALSVRCPVEEFGPQIDEHEAELARVTSSLKDLELKTKPFEEQVEAAVNQKTENFDGEEQALEKSVHSLEMKLSRMKEQQNMQRDLIQQFNKQELLQKQIKATSIEVARLEQLHAEFEAQNQKAKARIEKQTTSKKKKKATTSAAAEPDVEEENLKKQCSAMQENVQKFSETLEFEKERQLQRVQIAEEELKKAEETAIEARQERARKNESPKTNEILTEEKSEAMDPFLKNAKHQLLKLMEKKNNEGTPVAVAMKIIFEKGGVVLQKDLKAELGKKLNNSSRALQTIYSLVGLRLVKMDRTDPRKVCVVSCV